jgi:hypothetical protein
MILPPVTADTHSSTAAAEPDLPGAPPLPDWVDDRELEPDLETGYGEHTEEFLSRAWDA